MRTLGHELGAGKYLVKTVLYPVNYWICGGTILWFLDLFNIIGADNLNDLAVAYIVAHYGIPTSPEDFLVQFAVGAIAATGSWYIAMKLREGAV